MNGFNSNNNNGPIGPNTAGRESYFEEFDSRYPQHKAGTNPLNMFPERVSETLNPHPTNGVPEQTPQVIPNIPGILTSFQPRSKIDHVDVTGLSIPRTDGPQGMPTPVPSASTAPENKETDYKKKYEELLAQMQGQAPQGDSLSRASHILGRSFSGDVSAGAGVAAGLNLGLGVTRNALHGYGVGSLTTEAQREARKPRDRFYGSFEDGGGIPMPQDMQNDFEVGGENSPLGDIIAELEGGESLIQEDGTIQDVEGPSHEEGGVPVTREDVPGEAEVLSDELEVGKHANNINEMYDAKVKESDTFAVALEKIEKVIGVDAIEEEQVKISGKLKEAEKSRGLGTDTKELNKQELFEQMGELDERYSIIEEEHQQAFHLLYDLQEQDKGTGQEGEMMGGQEVLQEESMEEQGIPMPQDQEAMQQMMMQMEGGDTPPQDFQGMFLEGGGIAKDGEGERDSRFQEGLKRAIGTNESIETSIKRAFGYLRHDKKGPKMTPYISAKEVIKYFDKNEGGIESERMGEAINTILKFKLGKEAKALASTVKRFRDSPPERMEENLLDMQLKFGDEIDISDTKAAIKKEKKDLLLEEVPFKEGETGAYYRPEYKERFDKLTDKEGDFKMTPDEAAKALIGTIDGVSYSSRNTYNRNLFHMLEQEELGPELEQTLATIKELLDSTPDNIGEAEEKFKKLEGVPALATWYNRRRLMYEEEKKLKNRDITLEEYNINIDGLIDSQLVDTEGLEKYRQVAIENYNEIIELEKDKSFDFWMDREITSEYGKERVIANKYNVHFGTDFSATKGEGVPSFFDGEVVGVPTISKSAGWQIKIKEEGEDGEIITFMHLDEEPELKVGDKIRTGDIIGKAGNTGKVEKGEGGDGTHIHFQVGSPTDIEVDGEKIKGKNSKKFSKALQDERIYRKYDPLKRLGDSFGIEEFTPEKHNIMSNHYVDGTTETQRSALVDSINETRGDQRALPTLTNESIKGAMKAAGIEGFDKSKGRYYKLKDGKREYIEDLDELSKLLEEGKGGGPGANLSGQLKEEVMGAISRSLVEEDYEDTVLTSEDAGTTTEVDQPAQEGAVREAGTELPEEKILGEEGPGEGGLDKEDDNLAPKVSEGVGDESLRNFGDPSIDQTEMPLMNPYIGSVPLAPSPPLYPGKRSVTPSQMSGVSLDVSGRLANIDREVATQVDQLKHLPPAARAEMEAEISMQGASKRDEILSQQSQVNLESYLNTMNQNRQITDQAEIQNIKLSQDYEDKVMQTSSTMDMSLRDWYDTIESNRRTARKDNVEFNIRNAASDNYTMTADGRIIMKPVKGLVDYTADQLEAELFLKRANQKAEEERKATKKAQESKAKKEAKEKV